MCSRYYSLLLFFKNLFIKLYKQFELKNKKK